MFWSAAAVLVLARTSSPAAGGCCTVSAGAVWHPLIQLGLSVSDPGAAFSSHIVDGNLCDCWRSELPENCVSWREDQLGRSLPSLNHLWRAGRCTVALEACGVRRRERKEEGRQGRVEENLKRPFWAWPLQSVWSRTVDF